MRHQLLHFDFPIIANDESMQTKNAGRKYKLQQLFKMLSLSLDIGLDSLESFCPLVNGPVNDGQVEVSPDLNHQSTFQFIHVTHWLLVYALLYGAVVAKETAQVALIPYQAFKTQPIRKYMPKHSVKNHSRWACFDEAMPTCFRGPFFKKPLSYFISSAG